MQLDTIFLLNPEYTSLREFANKTSSVECLFIGGSYAYGLATEKSDLDLRGFCLRQTDDILVNYDFEQFENKATDTTLYSYSKFIRLLTKSNPGTLEWLGLDKSEQIYEGEIAKLIRQNKNLFLTKQAAKTFGGFATQQYKRLQNGQVAKGLGKDAYHTSKYMCHIIRLYDMGAEILRGEDIHTKRTSDKDLLMSIKNGDYLTQENKVKDSFWPVLETAEAKFHEAEASSTLPVAVDKDMVRNLELQIAKMIVFGNYDGKTIDEIVSITHATND